MKRAVRIAPLQANDEAEFISAVLASRTLHGRWVSPPATRTAFRDKRRRAQRNGDLIFCVRRGEDGALVGCVEITQVVRGAFRSAYLGYYAFAPHARQGLMAEGLRQVVRLAFTKLGLHRLEANIQPENLASLALVRRCGFQQEGYSPRYLKIRGRWRDHERWAIVAR